MNQVIIYTQAYDAQKTIERTIKSVVSQTYTNWVWHLVDNGSTDKTSQIIHAYAAQDARIIPARNQKNHVWESGNSVFEVLSRYENGDYFCWLDADDEYTADFLEKMLAFIARNQLDVGACGYDFIDSSTNKSLGVRKLNQDVILQGSAFETHFPAYHQFMRTSWCKLYSLSVLRSFDFEIFNQVSYGWDTIFAMGAFRRAKRVGILAESLHKYYVSPKSVSYQFDKKRIGSDRILHETACSFLVEKGGYVSPRNEDFLLAVYMNALKDTLNVLLNARISPREKTAGVIEIVTHKYTGRLMAKEGLGLEVGSLAQMSAQRKELFSTLAHWLLSQNEVSDELIEEYCNAGEMLSAVIENADGWLFFKKLRVRFFLEQNRKDEARDSLNELAELIPNDPDVMDFQQSC